MKYVKCNSEALKYIGIVLLGQHLYNLEYNSIRYKADFDNKNYFASSVKLFLRCNDSKIVLKKYDFIAI